MLSKKIAYWACSLAAAFAILTLALSAFQMGASTDLFVWGCDPFGYLQMADEIRTARSDDRAAVLSLHDAQTEALIQELKDARVPEDGWRQLVGPLSYRYFAGSDQVGSQYPPGTARVLSFFPKTGAVRYLNEVSISILTASGLLIIFQCVRSGLPFTSLMVAGALSAFFTMYIWIDQQSYSINAMILPLVFGTLLAWLSTRVTRLSSALILSLLAGLAIGLALQVRIANVLFVPALMMLFFPSRLRLLSGFLVGVVAAGILPLLSYNREITGHWWDVTYDVYDTKQSLACIGKNASYYLENAGASSLDHVLGLTLGLVALIGVITLSSRPQLETWRKWLGRNAGLVCAPVLAFAVPVTYFLTHTITIVYYLLPGMLLVGMLLTLVFGALEVEWRRSSDGALLAGWTYSVGTGFAIVILGATVAFAYSGRQNGLFQRSAESTARFDLPEEMLSQHAWIWADLYSGSVEYYGHHPAFKILACNSSTRKMIFSWLEARGEPQYIVADSAAVIDLFPEVRSFGWRLTRIGAIHGATCYRLVKP